MSHEKIFSANAEFQVIQALKQNRVKRSKLGEVFIEGTESIKKALAAGLELTRIILHDPSGLSDWANAVLDEHRETRIVELTYELYRDLCDRDQPSELLLTARYKVLKLRDLELPPSPLVLLFDRPGDYGNFGSLVRSANAFGVDAVLFIGHAIDVLDPKVIRSSLGTVFHTRIGQVGSMRELEGWIAQEKEQNCLVVLGTDSGGSIELGRRSFGRPLLLVLGNEAKGMSVALKAVCDHVVRIPLHGAADSLNVACAGSIFLWEVCRNDSPE